MGRGYEALAACRLGGVGEGVGVIDKAQPLTQLRLICAAHKSAQPSPRGSGEKALTSQPSDIKPKQHDIAVLDQIFLAL